MLFQQALRVGKRSHAETDIDRSRRPSVAAALDRVRRGPGRRAVVVGAGSMAALATATLTRRGRADVVVVNRTPKRASASPPSTASAPRRWHGSPPRWPRPTSSIAVHRRDGRARRPPRWWPGRQRPLAVVDLALPHDVEPEVADLPGVTLVTLADLAEDLHGSEAGAEVEAVRDIVAQEVAAFLTARRQASVTPTVVALRSMATEVVDAELARLVARLPDLDEASRAEVLQSLRRVADKLLHQPTVRVKELANETGAVSYAAALAELFALDPDAVEAVTRPEGLMTGPSTAPIRVGTRASLLATTQARHVADSSKPGWADRSSWSR